MKKGKRYTEEQILKVLQEIEFGASITSASLLAGPTSLPPVERTAKRVGPAAVRAGGHCLCGEPLGN